MCVNSISRIKKKLNISFHDNTTILFLMCHIRQYRQNHHFHSCTGLQSRREMFRNDMRRDAKLKAFCDARKLPTPQRPVSEKEILQAVANRRLFGMVECDIRLPDEWPSYFRHPNITRTSTSRRYARSFTPPTSLSTSSASTCKTT